MSRVVTCVNPPPVAEIRNSPTCTCPKRITPSRLQVPPTGTSTSQRVCTGPPVASIFLSRPSAKKPRKRLSGDQKGKVAPSAPSSGLASEEASARTQSCTLLPVAAVKASQFPSGETAIWLKLDLSGGRMENFMTCASGVGWRVKYADANPSIPSNNTAATAQASRGWPDKSDQ